jgi:1-deoxy-D-xylulose 5-phosphate reductoisomerase
MIMAGMFDSALAMLGNAAAAINPQLGSAVRAGTAAFANRDKLLAAGKSLSAAFTSLKEANGGTAPADAEAKHDALFAKVKAHAERTFDRAEGG